METATAAATTAASTFFTPTACAHSAVLIAAVLGGAYALYSMSGGHADASTPPASPVSPIDSASPPSKKHEYVSHADTPLGRSMVGRTFQLTGVALDRTYSDSEQFVLVDHSEFIANCQRKPLPRTSGIMPGHLQRGDLFVDENSGRVHIPLPAGTPVEVTDVRTVRGSVGWSHIWVFGRLKQLPRWPHVQKVRMSDVTHHSTYAYEMAKSSGLRSRPHLFEGVGAHEVALRDPGEVVICAKVAGVERADVEGQREPLERGFVPTKWMGEPRFVAQESDIALRALPQAPSWPAAQETDGSKEEVLYGGTMGRLRVRR